MPSSNPLPPKEAALFKRILKCYEHKQYKNGLKFAKQILSNPKYAEHGETLAMKGLILNCLAKKDEAYDNVKRGLRNDLKSHVCWHVYGLLQRSDRKYDEAIKCYRNALKWDKENLQILRDLSLLQVQMRDLEGYKETRHQLLLLRPAQRVSWIGFAMALHLVNEFDMAITVLEEYRKTQQPRSFDYEHSEFLLYENQVMREAGLLEKALDHLHQNQDYILDVLVFQESKADILMRLGRWEEAKQVVESLIERNTENWEYLRLLQRCSAAESTESRLRLFDQLCQRFQRAQAPRRMALYLEYDTADLRQRFRDTLNAYLRAGLSRGPPLFASIKSLYSDAWKVAVIEELLVSYLDEVNAGRDPTCPSAPAESTESDDSLLPCTALWVNIILAQHWSAVGRSADAMRHVDAAIEHTPTMVELYVLKAKIYKRGGDPAKAAQWMEEAQSMDTADRFLNSKCTKYLLRCDRVEDACSMASKFTREGVGAMENLNEMQCLWFLSECARAFQRQRRFGDALKKCIEIDRHFSEMVEDQFDFHTYCTRKMTLRSYMHMLRFEDGIRGHRFFVDAAVMAMNIYLELHDHPVADQDGLHDDQQDNLSAAELKKLKSKQRKAARRAQQQEEQRRDTEQSRPEELDPATLERVERPLDEAARWLQPLQDRAASSVDTHLLAFELHWRRGKPLLMLQAAKRVHAIDPQHPRLHEHVVRLASRTFHVADAVATVLKQELHRLMGGHDVVDFDRRFLEDNRHSLPHLLEAMHVSVVHLKTTPPETAADALYAAKLMGQPLHAGIQMMDALHKGTFGVCTTQQMDTLRQQCRLAWPLATAFE